MSKLKWKCNNDNISNKDWENVAKLTLVKSSLCSVKCAIEIDGLFSLI